jgi:hypothetical protein
MFHHGKMSGPVQQLKLPGAKGCRIIKDMKLSLALILLIFATACEDATLVSHIKETTCSTCRIYITTANYNGNFGSAAAADSICASDGNKPATGTYKAMVVDGTRTACTTANCSGGFEGTNWVLRANTTYTRDDGAALGTTTASGIFSFPLSNNIGAGSGTTYTGIGIDWTTNSNCLNWTDSSSSSRIGSIATTGNTTVSLTTQSCSVARSLICVEQ